MENQDIPRRPDGSLMLKFEVKMRAGENGTIEKAIFIGDELLDWQVNVSQLIEARQMGTKYFKSVQRDVEKHFVESVSEFIGRKMTPQGIKTAIKTGWI